MNNRVVVLSLFPKPATTDMKLFNLSWVLTKPGLFHERAAVAGYPTRNIFHDVCYKPAWENIGKWNEYNAVTKIFTGVIR